MILDLSFENKNLTLVGESFGRTLSSDELIEALRPFFSNWHEPILEGRGALHLLQRIAQGVSSPLITYGPTLSEAAKALPHVLRLIALGYIVPRLIRGEGRWELTALPESYEAQLCHALADAWMRTCASTPLTRAQARRQNYRTAEDAWLAALRAPQAKAMDDKTLARHIDLWVDPLFEGRRGALPLLPQHSDDGWRLQITAPQENGTYAPEVLRLLGQAIAIAPLLAFPQPWDEATFVRFLNEAVPALRAAAFDVTLPPAFESPTPEIKETALGIEAGQVKITQTISFGGIELSIAEAQAILDAGESLAFVQGEWRYVDLKALREALEACGTTLQPCHTALPLLLAGALRVSPTAQDVQDFLREMTHPPAGDLPLREVLRTYQAQGVCWLMQARNHHLGVCLADDMGLGKTLQTIAFLLSHKNEEAMPALVVAPLTVLPVWEREFARWAPQLKVLRHEGSTRIKEAAQFFLNVQKYDIVLTTYGYLWRDHEPLSFVSWSSLILDEAQQIKNPATRQSHIARSLKASFRLALTGTPIENSLDDLWSILDFLNPNLFGTRRDFAQRYADPEKLRRAVANFLLRRLKSDPSILPELPPKILQEHYAQLSEVQAVAYDYALASYAREVRLLPPEERPGAALVLLTRLKEICDHPALVESLHDENDWTIEASGKVLLLLPLLEEIFAQGESVLIFTQFARMGAFLQKVLTERFGRPVAYIHGGLSMKKRKEEMARFADDPNPAPMILSLRTGAFGLTLTKANHVVHFDRWWNPAVEAQATDRAHRIGQTRTVVVHHIVCRGTLEDRIAQILRDKQTLAEDIIAPTSAARLARLPADTLLSLLKR